MLRWIKRIAVGLLGLVIFLLLVGVGYEQIMRARTAQQFPPPGKRVDVGGYRMQIDCRGTGSPTVVFEAGLDAMGSLSWSAVQDAVAGQTRACAYSRAGIVWSDARLTSFSADLESQELHRLLENAGERAPWVMVGHSLGGPYIMNFTRLYPQEVAGLVFVDASHPDQIQRMTEAAGKPLNVGDNELKIASALRWTGLPRLLAAREGAPGVPPHAKAAQDAYLSVSVPAVLDEEQAIAATLASAGKLRELGERPIVVLTAAKPYPDAVLKALDLTPAQGQQIQKVWAQMHDEQATWSSHSRSETLPDSTHYVQFDRPDVVIKAVRDVVDQVRAAWN
jgi:pimeloyl-ACP methyl ester carboxylesterase